MNQKIQVLTALFFLLFAGNVFANTITITPSGNDQTTQIQNALNNLNNGDKIILDGDFIISGTILLPSDITWELRGTMTLAPNSYENGSLERMTWDADPSGKHGNGRYTVIGAVQPAKNIVMYGGRYEGDGDNNNKQRLRFIQMMDIKDSHFYDMEVNNISDDCFTLGNGATNNLVERVVARDAGGKVSKDGGNAMTDNGSYNTWKDCRAIDGGSDGWTPKCQYSTFIRCSAENNTGPGWGFYAREDGPSEHVGIDIIGNKLIDCVGFGSKHSSGVSFDISSNCPGGRVIDNYIEGRFYDNHSAGVEFRNKDDVNQGVIRDNEVDIHCWGNKSLTRSGNNHAWAGGLGTENDRDHEITNVFGSVVCYDNVNYDVNLKGAKNCNITVYAPNAENAPAINYGTSNNATIANFDCNTTFSTWSQNDYCNGIVNPPTNDVIIEDSFEETEGFGNWNDGGDDCGRSTDKSSDGIYSVRLADDKSSSLMYSKKLDLAAYSEVVVEFWYDVESYESSDVSELQISIDDGASYTTVGSLDRNSVGNVSITVYNIIFTSETRFRFISLANSSNDLIYFDEVKVIGSKTLSTSEVISDYLGLNHYNYPNPFREETTISFELSEYAQVSLNIYNMQGQETSSLLKNEPYNAGVYSIVWNASNLNSGIYTYALRVVNNKGLIIERKKMCLIK